MTKVLRNKLDEWIQRIHASEYPQSREMMKDISELEILIAELDEFWEGNRKSKNDLMIP